MSELLCSMAVPRAGVGAGSAVIRRTPDDFRVSELLEPALSGDGEHFWIRLRKTGENTVFVAQRLAECAGVSPRQVGFAGRKDRHAVTTQWFSMQLPGKPDPDLSALPDSVEILQTGRHRRKLQVGYLQGNAFELVLRDFCGDAAQLNARLSDIALQGVPNYFGRQRFGRDGANLHQAHAWLTGGAKPRGRQQRNIWVSAARSWVFNSVLAKRVEAGTWNTLIPGERVLLNGSLSHFEAELIDDTLLSRLAQRDVHPSGPLWGRGGQLPTAAAGDLEQAVVAHCAPIPAALEGLGLEAQRRALRLFPDNLNWEWIDPSTLRLCFSLPAGCFATTVLAECLDCMDVGAQESSE